MAKLNLYRPAALLLCFLFLGAGSMPDFKPAEFPPVRPESVALGQLLFFDPLLSGNRNMACASCHHPAFGTSDSVSLSLGEGGIGLGPVQVADPHNMPEQRIGRNAPALFNLGATEFTVMFHDGRLERDFGRKSGMRTPLADDMVVGFNSVLSAQAMFPVVAQDEMAGHYSENSISRAVRQGLLAQAGGAWDLIAARVGAIDEYRRRFDAIIGPRKIRFTDIANAIADFIRTEWRADNSDFDRYLQGVPLPAAMERGRGLFYGKAGCAHCHSGRFQTDHGFHAIAMPQIGPGKTARFESHHRDTGRMRVTGRAGDAYRFRTPSLRNVALTAPYGHDGAYATLRAVVLHHLDPVKALRHYDRRQVILPLLAGADDFAILNDPAEVEKIAAANELSPVRLTKAELSDLLAFLDGLTDRTGAKGRLGVPDRVPSGLPVPIVE